MKQSITLFVAWLCSLTAFAQWTKPEAPAALEALPTEETAYLYNADADAFYLGANNWNTRASVSETKGYKVSLAQYVASTSSTWDGVSYKIMTAIEAGDPAGQTLATYLTEWNAIWVDAPESSTADRAWTFNKQEDGTYLIGLSSQNKTFSPEQNYDNSYLGLIPTMEDTRLYLCDKYSEDYEFSSCKVRWYFVSADNYTAYLTAKAQYEAAVLLGEDLENAKATYPSVDLSTVEAIYNNKESSAEELSAARITLVELLESAASVESPLDVTLRYVTNPSYDNNDNTGWSGNTPGFQTYGNAEFYEKTYDYTQTLTVPAGVYRVSVDAFYRAGWADKDAEALTALTENGDKSALTALLYASGADLTPENTLFLASTGASETAIGTSTSQNSFGYIPNDMKTAAAYWTAGQYQPTSLLAMAGEDGQLVIGLKNETKVDGGWTIFDDWKLESLGDEDAAYVALKDDYLSRTTDYQAQVEAETLEYYNHADYEAYKTTRAALDAATTKSGVVTGLQDFATANDSLAASVEAYAAYYEKYVEGNKFLDEKGESLMGEDMDLLSDYLTMEVEPGDELPQFAYGTSLYILKNGLPTTAQVTAETAFLQQLMNNALANGMSDGTDCSDLIKNAHFTEEGVWNKTGFPEWPVGTDDYKMAQGYSILFDVNQTLTGLQNGLYELTLNDFFRPANIGSADYNGETYRAYVYMNDDEEKLNLIDAGATETASASDDVAITEGQYVPNSLSGAATAFQAGRYQQTVYGIVTDGTLKIGVRNDLRYEDCWAVFSDFKLVFRAKNAEVLANVLAATLTDAQSLLSNKCGNTELTALQTAIENAQGTPEDAYQALLDLKTAMTAVDSCTLVYAQLQEAISNGEQTLTDYAESATTDALDALQNAVNTAKAGYESGAFDQTEAAEQATAVSAAVVAVKMGGESTTEKDVSDLIVNNTFDPTRGSKDAGTIEGWTTSAMNGYKEYTVSYNRAGIDLKQTLSGLPAGHYRLTVHTYYRAGYAAEDYALNQKDSVASHLTTLYANVEGGENYSTTVMNLCEDAQPEQVDGSKCDQLDNGLYVPNGTSASVTWFNAGYYLNTLEFDVAEDGTNVTIGLSKTKVLSNDYEVVGAWNLYYTAPQQAQDVSSLIVNNTFDPARGSKDSGTIEGWTTSAMNGYKENTVSYNRAGIDLWQTIHGLPAGNYKVTVHTYYRAGYAAEDYALYLQDSEASHLTTLYANVEDGQNYSTKVMNLCEDAQPEQIDGSKCDQLDNGLYVPNGTTATVTWFNAGYYLNELTFTVPNDNGTVTIGLKKTEVLSNDYEVVGTWNLYYYGNSTPTAITSPETSGADSVNAATPVGYYSLSGARLGAPQRGINLIKMSDGTTRKVLVK